MAQQTLAEELLLHSGLTLFPHVDTITIAFPANTGNQWTLLSRTSAGLQAPSLCRLILAGPIGLENPHELEEVVRTSSDRAAFPQLLDLTVYARWVGESDIPNEIAVHIEDDLARKFPNINLSLVLLSTMYL